jgi:hypothetical protein
VRLVPFVEWVTDLKAHGLRAPLSQGGSTGNARASGGSEAAFPQGLLWNPPTRGRFAAALPP